MKILVTGGAGFIGSHLTQRLQVSGHEVCVLDNLASGHSQNIPEGVDFISADIADAEVYHSLSGRFNQVIHLASRVGQDASFDDPAEDIRVNCEATALLLEWSKRTRVERFIFASSMNVYGNGNPTDVPLSEAARIEPISPYAVGKFASEQLLNIYGISDFPTVSLRLFNVYGPGQDLLNMRQGMVSIFLKYICDGKPIHIRGSLDRTRDFIFVDDVVTAFTSVMRSEAVGTYNVGTGIATSVWDLIRTALQILDYDPDSYPLVHEDPTKNDQVGLSSDSRKLQRLGWEPEVSLQDGLSRTLDAIHGDVASRN